jgi:hypothetical protein
VDAEESGAQARLRSIAVEHYALVFARYVRRLDNRRADMERAGCAPAEVAENLKAERERAGLQLVQENREVTDQLGLHPQFVMDAVEAVNAGTDPRAAAQALLERNTR